MPIRYFFKQLLLPPGGLLLLLFFAFWWRTSRPRLARLCGVCGFFGLWLTVSYTHLTLPTILLV